MENQKVALDSRLVTPNIVGGTKCVIVGCETEGHAKTKGAYSCRACWQRLGGGDKAKRAIQAAIEASDTAFSGMEAADAGNVKRKTIGEPIFTLLKVPGDSKPKSFVDSTRTTRHYLQGNLHVSGGVVQVSTFAENIGEVKPGMVYPGVLSVRTRKTSSGEVHYLRFQVAEGPVSANTQVLITDDGMERDFRNVEGMPKPFLFNEERLSRVGYLIFTEPRANRPKSKKPAGARDAFRKLTPLPRTGVFGSQTVPADFDLDLGALDGLDGDEADA